MVTSAGMWPRFQFSTPIHMCVCLCFHVFSLRLYDFAYPMMQGKLVECTHLRRRLEMTLVLLFA